MSGIDERRRRFLGAAGIGTVIVVAGCVGDPGSGGGDDEDGDTAAGSGYAVDDHPIDEPMEFTGAHMCAVCAMTPSDYSRWMGQLAHEDGTGVFFCTPGCMSAYVAVPDHFGGPDAPIAGAWTTDFETGELIDATEAYFVLEREGERGETMELNPRPFADRDDVDAYLEDADGLDEDDVIGLEEIDLDVARLYRGYRVPR